MITKTAWKNIWRNKVRSMVVIASITIGIFSGVFAVGVMDGMMNQRVEAALNDELAHIQITHPEFRSNNDLNFYIEDCNQISADIRRIEGVEEVTSRMIVTGMANTASNSTGVQINGVDPQTEVGVFDLNKKVYPGSGSYFSEEIGSGYVYIGVDLAKSLNIIRYIITEEVLDTLTSHKLPPAVISKLEQYKEIRFKNEKSFKKELKSILSEQEVAKYGYIIKNESQNFSNRARLTLTFLDSQNNQTGGRFRIAGLYDISNSLYENMQVFVLNEELSELMGFSPDTKHQIVVKLSDIDRTREIADRISELYPDMEVLAWQKLAPDIAMMAEMSGAMYGMFLVIILAALAFGIVNTMLMVVLERTKEIGMLTAIGMNKKKVFRMIMTESIFLSIIGGVGGMIVGKLVIMLTSRRGFSISAMEEGFEGMGFSSHIYPEIGSDFFIMVTILIIITGILSSIYPALKALKLNPVDALKTE